MWRCVTLAAFLVVLAIVPASAQRGGMRSSGGGRGIGVGHPAGGGHGFGGMRSGGVRVGGMHAGIGTRSFPRDGFGRVRIRIRNRPFHHCFGCFSSFASFASPWWGWGYPFGWWDSSSSYDSDREQETMLANQMNELNLEEQSLRERENSLREREEQDASARRYPAQAEQAPPSSATVLVFRDQHQQEITNYAIAGSTLWVLNDHLATKKIPLAELDLDATTKANEERGVQFQVPR
jgi:hypothetical protein